MNNINKQLKLQQYSDNLQYRQVIITSFQNNLAKRIKNIDIFKAD